MGNLICTIDFWVFAIGVILACQSFIRAVRKWEFYGDCDVFFPKKELKYQKPCEFLIACYHTLMVFTGAWFILVSYWSLFSNVDSPMWVITIAPFVLLLMYFSYFALWDYIMYNRKLKKYQDKIVKKHKTIEMLDEKNDFEIDFKRAYFKAENQTYKAVVWELIVVLIWAIQ